MWSEEQAVQHSVRRCGIQIISISDKASTELKRKLILIFIYSNIYCSKTGKHGNVLAPSITEKQQQQQKKEKSTTKQERNVFFQI